MSLIRARKLALLLQSRQNAHLNRLVDSGAVKICFMGGPHTRQLHCSFRTQNFGLKTHFKSSKLKERRSSLRPSSPPRYVAGPTLPGLRIVVRALQDSGTTMATREIWEAIHKDTLEVDYAFPEGMQPPIKEYAERIPEPLYPIHPVRSLKYLKSVLLATLEANGRVRKVHTVRPPNDNEKEQFEKRQKRVQGRNERKRLQGLMPNGVIPQGIDTWVWELVAPNPGTIPVEERQSIPMRDADVLWMKSLDEVTFRRFHTPFSVQHDAESNSIIKYTNEREVDAKEHISEDETFSSQAASRPRSAPDVSPYEKELAEKLATRWQKVALKDEVSSIRAGVSPSTGWKIGDRNHKHWKKQVDWRDYDLRKERNSRRTYLLDTAPSFNDPPWSRNQGGKAVAVEKDKDQRKGKNPDDVGLFNDSPNVEPPAAPKEIRPLAPIHPRKKVLHPNEPEYRQSRLHRDVAPIGLKDPRRRQYGFHYGLPKQKELLRAANARVADDDGSYDHVPWPDKDQPPRDYSHLSLRRQRRRVLQNEEIIRKLTRSAQWKTLNNRVPAIAAPQD